MEIRDSWCKPWKTGRARKLLLWGAPVVVGGCLVVLWHLFLRVKVEPHTAQFLPPLLIVINGIPVAGLFVFVTRWSRLATGIMAIPLAVALIIGGYSHFLSFGADNVFRRPPGAFIPCYQISAVLLVILEAPVLDWPSDAGKRKDRSDPRMK